MFGLPSLSKLLVLVAVVLAVWYGYKLLTRLEDARKAKGGQDKAKGGPEAKSEIGSMETVKCSVCGIFLASDAPSNCGREGCPY